MTALHFTRVTLATSAAAMLASSNLEDACETLAGTDFYAEALGHIEFVAVSAAEVAAVEYPIEKLAIGPKLSSPEFGPVSSIILPAVLESELDYCGGSELQLDVTVNRVQYLITIDRDGQLRSTGCYPLHHQELCDEHWATARWLAAYFSARLRNTKSDPGTASQAATESIAQPAQVAQ
jgi:hypothetical protein